MPTIKVAKAFNLLTATNEKPQRFEVGEHPVTEEIASHWYVQAHLERPKPAEEPAPEVDLATASRDDLVAYLNGSLSAHLATHLTTLTDDEIRDFAIRQKGAAEAAAAGDAAEADEGGDEEEGSAGGADESDAKGAPGQTAAGEAGDAGEDPADRKAEIREQLKAMGAELPHHNAGLDKHEAALDAAQAEQSEQVQPDLGADDAAAA